MNARAAEPVERVAFRAFGVRFEIEVEDAAMAGALRVCYGALAASSLEGTDTLVRASIRGEGGRFAVRVEGRETAHAEDAISAVRALNHELLHALMLRRLDLLYVHAGVVAIGDAAVVLPGLSGSGKSTLVVALLRAGHRFLSDELLAFDAARDRALAYARAPKIRDACVAYFPEYENAFVGHGEGRFLALEALGAERLAASAPPRLVVLPSWDSAGRDELEPLSPGQGLLRLVESTLNFGAGPARALHDLGELVRAAPCYALRWRDPRLAAERIEAAMARS